MHHNVLVRELQHLRQLGFGKANFAGIVVNRNEPVQILHELQANPALVPKLTMQPWLRVVLTPCSQINIKIDAVGRE